MLYYILGNLGESHVILSKLHSLVLFLYILSNPGGNHVIYIPYNFFSLHFKYIITLHIINYHRFPKYILTLIKVKKGHLLAHSSNLNTHAHAKL